MSEQKKDQQSPAFEWEQALIDDYRRYRWGNLMEPLCERLQLWKSGEITHEELDPFMEEISRQICEVRNLLGQRRDRLVNLIQWWDREWFLEWVRDYSPPASVVLADPSGPTAAS